MKNKVIIGVAVILVLLGGGYFFMKSRSAQPTQSGTPSQQTSNAPKSLKDLLGLGTAQKCTFDQGTVYIASGKVRGDFTTTENGKQVATHMISMANTSYIWMEGQATGLKTTFDASAQPTGETGGSTPSSETAVSGGLDVNKPADYKCEGWSADSTMFELPKGVTFQDFSSLIPSSAPSIPGY